MFFRKNKYVNHNNKTIIFSYNYGFFEPLKQFFLKKLI